MDLAYPTAFLVNLCKESSDPLLTGR